MSTFHPTRAKVQLKLSINRLKMLQAKKASLNKHQRREIAALLEAGKEESARIKVEHIIREDFNMEAMEILELYCELLMARFGLLEQMKHCDPAIAEAVNSIIYATPRTDQVKELSLVRDQLMAKFGKEFIINAMENREDCVNPRLVSKLTISTPDPFLVDRYLEEIARTYSVNWKSDSIEEDSDDGDDGGVKELELEPPSEPITLQPTSPALAADSVEDQTSAIIDLPNIPANSPSKKGAKAGEAVKTDINSDFDELARRFEALKKRD